MRRLACFGFVLATSVTAFAQPGDAAQEEARIHFQAGRAHYDAGRLDEAIESYQLAYDLSRRPEMLHNIAIAHRDAGRRAQAAVFLRRFIQEADLAAEEQTRLESAIRRLETEQPSGTELPSEPEPSSELEPSLGAEGSDGLGLAPWIVLGAGGATLVAALVTGLSTVGRHGSLSSDCDDSQPIRMCPDGWEDRVQTGRDLALATDVLWISGAVITGVGLVLAVLSSL